MAQSLRSTYTIMTPSKHYRLGMSRDSNNNKNLLDFLRPPGVPYSLSLPMTEGES